MSNEQAIDYAKGQAAAYVWGRQDAGESSRDTGYSLDFGQHYAELKRSYLEGRSGYLPSIQTAFIAWRDSRSSEAPAQTPNNSLEAMQAEVSSRKAGQSS